MSHFKEEDFVFVKEQLTDGYISPIMTRPAVIVFFIVSLMIVGVACIAVFASNTVIGWEGLSTFWQGAFIAQAILLAIQLLTFLLVRKVNNVSQFILLIAYFIFTIKLGLDFFFTIAMVLMDRNIYENVQMFLLFIVLLGVVVLLLTVLFAIKKMRENKLNKTTTNKKNKKTGTIIFPFTFFLALLIGYLFRYDMLSIYGELSLLFIIAIVVYYGILIASVLPVFGIYCYIKYPSFRIEANMKKKG